MFYRLTSLLIILFLFFTSFSQSDTLSVPEIWKTYTTSDGLASNTVSAIEVDSNNGIWCGSRGEGASYFDGTKWTAYNTSNSGISSNDLLWITEDKDGVVWFGPTWDVLSSFDGTSWKTYNNFSTIRNISFDKNNVKWITSYGNGVARFDGTNWTYFNTSNGLHTMTCEVIVFDLAGNLWLSYTASGVSKYDGISWKYYDASNGLVDSNVMAMSVDLDGVIWFGTSGGVSSFDGTTWKKYTTADGLVSNYINSIQTDQNNIKWFGSFDGIGSFDGVSWKKYNSQNSPLADNETHRILVDKNNVKWIGHYGYGVTSFLDINGPYLSLTSPATGEIFESGKTCIIKWSAYDVQTVSLYYSGDNGATWENIESGLDASLLSFEWQLPQTVSETCFVKIVDDNDNSVYDICSGAFSISLPFLTLLSPNGGEQYSSNGICPIRWTSIGVDSLNIEYSANNGSAWKTIVGVKEAVSGTYRWKISEDISNECLIRITDTTNPARSDISDMPFSITAPNSGALKFGYDDYVTIPDSPDLNPASITVECWVKFNELSSHAQFFVCKGGHDQGAYNLFEVTRSGGPCLKFELNSFDISVIETGPLNIVPGIFYHVAGTYDGDYIRVYLNGSLVGEKKIGYYQIGTSHPLYFNHHIGYPWLFSGELDEVRIWSLARTAVQINETMYSEIDSGDGLVGVWHLNEGEGQTVYDSAGNHTGYLGERESSDGCDPQWVGSNINEDIFMVFYPNGNNSLKPGTEITVEWGIDAQTTISILFSSDKGATWETLAENVDASLQSCKVTLPDIESSKCLIRIVDESDSSVFDQSDAVFTINNNILVDETTPGIIKLLQNFPNPFNPSTTISFSLPLTSKVVLSVYSINGQKLATLKDETMSAGLHSVVWEAKGVSSGIYFYTLESAGKKIIGKMLLVK